ncbi:hypothetical protein MMC25_003795 [Agyrium rufum]|nr:hypothetical protein [Agyrium rufum]
MESHYSMLIPVLYTLPPVAFVFVALRVFIHAKRGFSRDAMYANPQYATWSTTFMVLAWFLCAINTGLCIMSTMQGFGRKDDELTEENIRLGKKYNYLSQGFGIMGSCIPFLDHSPRPRIDHLPTGAAFARVSVALFELYVFGPSLPNPYPLRTLSRGFSLTEFAADVERRSSQYLQRHPKIRWLKSYRKLLAGIIVSQVGFNAACTIQIYAMCQPFSARWNHTAHGHCDSEWSHVIVGWIQGGMFDSSVGLTMLGDDAHVARSLGFNALCAFILAFVALFKIMPLQMKASTKVGLCAVLCVGIADGVACAIKTSLLDRLLLPEDCLYHVSPLVIAWTIENYVAIMCGSVPYLRPVLTIIPKLAKRWMSSGGGDDSGNTVSPDVFGPHFTSTPRDPRVSAWVDGVEVGAGGGAEAGVEAGVEGGVEGGVEIGAEGAAGEVENRVGGVPGVLDPILEEPANAIPMIEITLVGDGAEAEAE